MCQISYSAAYSFPSSIPLHLDQLLHFTCVQFSPDLRSSRPDVTSLFQMQVHHMFSVTTCLDVNAEKGTELLRVATFVLLCDLIEDPQL